jgi:hypothetical protein
VTELEVQGLKLQPLSDVCALPDQPNPPVSYQVVDMFGARLADIIRNNLTHKWEYRTLGHPRRAGSFDSPQDAFEALKDLYRADC